MYQVVLPPNWETEEPPRHLEDQDVDLNEFNRLTSTTQDSEGKIVLNRETGLFEYVYNFCFQLDYQFICTDSNFHSRGPVLVIQVCHDDSWGKYLVEGYTFCELPRKPGHYNIECGSWRPYESLYSQVFSFFIGGAVKVRDLADIAATSIRAGEGYHTVLNRYTLKTVTGGKVFVEMNMCSQNA